MSPLRHVNLLRKWMTARRLPAWYSWVVVVLLPIMASTGVLVVSLRVNERSIERERAARVAVEQAQESSRVALCGIYVLLDNAYQKAPPSTDTGKNLAAAVAAARQVNHC